MSAATLPAIKSATTFDIFRTVSFNIGKIVAVEPFPKARNPSYKVRVVFGPAIGEKCSSAQLPANYPNMQSLFNKVVLAVTNLPPRKIAGFASEILIVGFPDDHGHVHLLNTRKRDVLPGLSLHFDNTREAKLQVQYETSFAALDIRSATVENAEILDDNSFKLSLNVGELGRREAILNNCNQGIIQEILTTQVVVLINLKTERSDHDCHVLSFTDEKDQRTVPFGVDQPVRNGVQLF